MNRSKAKRLVLIAFVWTSFHIASATDAVLTHNSNLRADPSTKNPVIVLVNANSTVTVLSSNPQNGYYQVRTSDQKTGWLLARNLRMESTSAGTAALSRPSSASAGKAGPDNIYANAAFTPGAIDTRVTQANIKFTICVAGYTGCKKGWTMGNGMPCPYEVRPAVAVTDKLKTEIMTSYGFTGSAESYELDHLISLQLGGCTSCKENLWPEAYKPRPGAREKDAVETYLKRQVCEGTMTLDTAQKQIADDWYAVYKQLHPNN